MGTAIEASREAATATANGYFLDADHSFGECRSRLISYLVKLNHALNGDLPDLSEALLLRFCDCLVDYLSAGHFRVFQRCSLAAQHYAAIEATTDAGMAFNDRYGQQRTLPAAELRLALEGIARVLSKRFELEDALLAGGL